MKIFLHKQNYLFVYVKQRTQVNSLEVGTRWSICVRPEYTILDACYASGAICRHLNSLSTVIILICCYYNDMYVMHWQINAFLWYWILNLHANQYFYEGGWRNIKKCWKLKWLDASHKYVLNGCIFSKIDGLNILSKYNQIKGHPSWIENSPHIEWINSP